MATADALLKPDHATGRRHFIFTEEHDQLRESIHAFVTKELAPHADEWEETTFPDWVFRRMGELVQTDMATPPVFVLGTEEQKREYLVPAIRGERISCLGITEPDAGSDVAGIQTRAVRDGDDWVISGSKTFITNGHRADLIVLVTKTDPDAGYDGV